MELKGAIAVVTGASSGIGAATAAALRAQGSTVIGVDLRPSEGVRAVDVTDGPALTRLAAELEATHGRVDLLVNNAGVTVVGRFEDHTEADWARVMGVNFSGVLYGCRAFLPGMQARRRGWVVNLSSLFGLMGVPGQTAYCASKYAVRGLSEALHAELRGSGVGITVVHPGGVRTRILEDADLRVDAGLVAPARDFFARRTLRPERVAEAIVGAVRREQHRLLVCPETTLIDGLRRLSPNLGNQLGVWALERAMKLKVPGRA
jgi:NAD(P)-dependent dehydrogenase (short-subunit alcohol dehydrogenase family)